MVYIFFVQPGDMTTFDNEISIMQSVEDLKEKIKEKIGISKEQQVLLINGGESLDSKKNLCSYMAGTDTNPIYLFSTNYDVSNLEILRNLYYDDIDIKEKLIDSMKLPVALDTVNIRTQVALEYFEIAKKQLEFCESMVHEQHLQQQGWSAVIANLDDIITEFKKRWALFLKFYSEFMTEKKTYEEILAHFQEDKTLLSRVPVIDILLETQKEPMDSSKLSEATNTSLENDSKEITLYEWISSDNKHSLDILHGECLSKLKRFEIDLMPSLKLHVEETLQSAEKHERREIEGLGKRLYDLEELLRKIKKSVEHQSDMAQAFQQNRQSASQSRDLSILPDLCTTHVRQLEYIKQYHDRLMEDRGRVVKAKFELSKSLCARIGWVQNIENKLWELDSHIVYFHECLIRLRKHIEVFQQMHQAPTTYVNAVVEVVRRRAFSQLFLMWASDLACQQLTIYNEEMTRRKDFNAQFEGHFLTTLFQGMGDIPPAFATEAPAMFDAKLPDITQDDIEKLRKDLPDFAENLVLPDMEHVTNFFLGKNAPNKDKDKVDDTKAVEEKLMQAVSDVGLASNLDKNLLKATSSETCLVTAQGLPNIKDGCESETDTEEFEKVTQSPLELTFPQEASAIKLKCLEDNLQISRSEYERVKSVLVNVDVLARQDIERLRDDLVHLKGYFKERTDEFIILHDSLSNSWRSLTDEVAKNEKELTEVMLKEHETETDNYRYNLLEKDEIISKLEQDKKVIEERNEEMSREMKFLEERIAKMLVDNAITIDSLKKEINDKETEKEKAIRELSEKLKFEHKTEIENIKSRIKLMTMERSPSLTSLEREKSGDLSSLPSHTTLLAQMQDNFEMDKEKAVMEEQKRHEKILQDRINELTEQFREQIETVTQSVQRITDEKEKQIDLLRERDKNLNLEITKLKMTIQQLTEGQQQAMDLNMEDIIENLVKEKMELLKELGQIKKERENLMTSSVAICDEKLDASTSPLEPVMPYDLSRSEITTSSQHRLNIGPVKVGDIVLIVWNPQHANFTMLQEGTKHICFLHPDSLEKMGLTVVDKVPNKNYCTGEVIDKEYCHARKSGNRYKVPKGAKFFRIKVKPLEALPHARGMMCCHNASTFESVAEEPRSTTTERKPSLKAATASSDSVAQPVEIKAQTVYKHFAEDSGIVENVEQAMAAIEDADKQHQEDRPEPITIVYRPAVRPSTWLETMFRSIFFIDE